MIKTYPDEFLTRVLPTCKKPVKQDIVDLMMDVAYETECLGLAANQVGILHRIIVVFKRLMVKPVILEFKGDVSIVSEGCLSLPNQMCVTQRHDIIRIQWQTPNLKETKTQQWGGMMAYVAQHEIDHLNGRLINDSK